MSTWKHFSDFEVKGLVSDLIFKLDRARDLFNLPIVITSGYRDPGHNNEIGGVPNSSHTQGKAVDIRCADKNLQIKLAWALGSAGFRRIGVYDKHIHVDVAEDKPSPSFWTGESH